MRTQAIYNVGLHSGQKEKSTASSNHLKRRCEGMNSMLMGLRR